MSKSDNSMIKLNEFVPYRMVKLASNMSNSLSKIYKREFDITVAEWRVLAQLAERKVLYAKDIGLRTSMDKSKVSRAVKSLEQRAYLQKKLDIKDQRATSLSLTSEGLELYKSIVPMVLQWERSLMSVLNQNEFQSLMVILDKLDGQLS